MQAPPVVLSQDLDAYKAGEPNQLLEQVTADVRGYCGWHVTPSISETVTLDSSGSATIMLPTLHVASVDSVSFNGTALTAVDDFAWSPVGYLSFKADGPFFSETPWYAAAGAVVVTFTHGYGSAPDLAGVILAKAARAQGNPRAVSRQQAGPFSEQYELASGFTADEQAILDRYRLPPRP